MKQFSIFLVSVGIMFLELIQPAFAHGVHCGITCPVGGSGIDDWYLAQTASENMFYISVVIYGAIVILFWISFLKRKSISTIIKK